MNIELGSTTKKLGRKDKKSVLSFVLTRTTCERSNSRQKIIKKTKTWKARLSDSVSVSSCINIKEAHTDRKSNLFIYLSINSKITYLNKITSWIRDEEKHTCD